MGTYTTNYNLFMPSVGEQGWGDLVNGNFSTLDSTMKGLDTRTTALESADTAFDARITTLEAGEFESITADEFIGGEGNFSGAVNATAFNRTSVHSVSSGTPSTSVSTNWSADLIFVLPNSSANYTGNIVIRNNSTGGDRYIYYRLGIANNTQQAKISKGSTYTLTFTNVDSVYIWAGNAYELQIGKVSIT